MKQGRGYFGVAVFHPKTAVNTGTLFRTAQIFGVDFCATIGQRYKRQASDTMNASGHVPFFSYATFEDFYANLPVGCQVVGVELASDADLLEDFRHPERAVYLLGAEDHGLPPSVISRCHRLVKMRGVRSMNVAVAGSIVIYDRAWRCA